MAAIPDAYIQNSYAALMNLIEIAEGERHDLAELRKMVQAAVGDLKAAKADAVDDAKAAAKSAIGHEVRRVNDEIAAPMGKALTTASRAGTVIGELEGAAQALLRTTRRSIVATVALAIASVLVVATLAILYIAPFSRTGVDVASLMHDGRISGCIDSKKVCILLPVNPRVVVDGAGKRVLILDADGD